MKRGDRLKEKGGGGGKRILEVCWKAPEGGERTGRLEKKTLDAKRRGVANAEGERGTSTRDTRKTKS